jgi:hypothetical protein
MKSNGVESIDGIVALPSALTTTAATPAVMVLLTMTKCCALIN